MINEYEDFDKEAEQTINELKNTVRRFLRQRSGVGLWGNYQKLTKEDKKQFVQDFMAEFNCSMVTVYNYINRRKPIAPEKLERIKSLFAKYGIN